MLRDRSFVSGGPSEEELQWRRDRMTLERAFSLAGVMSREDAADRILAERVTVNDRIVVEAGFMVQPVEDRIACDGRRLRFRRRVYFALHKPTGLVTSYGDPEGQRTIYEILPHETGWVFPVGYLDKNSSGLLILTNDVGFGDRVADPDSGTPGTYLVTADIEQPAAVVEALRGGVVLRDGYRTPSVEAAFLGRQRGRPVFEMVLLEAKRRQIRRMIDALGGKVSKIVRTHIGALSLGDMAVGSCKRLEPGDLALLNRPDSGDDHRSSGSGP